MRDNRISIIIAAIIIGGAVLALSLGAMQTDPTPDAPLPTLAALSQSVESAAHNAQTASADKQPGTALTVAATTAETVAHSTIPDAANFIEGAGNVAALVTQNAPVTVDAVDVASAAPTALDAAPVTTSSTTPPVPTADTLAVAPVNGGSSAPVAQADTPPIGPALFTELGFSADMPARSRIGVTRSRTVGVNMAALGGGNPNADSLASVPASLVLNLFDGTALTANLLKTEARESGASGYVWQGKIAGEALSDVTLVIGTDYVYGTVNMPGVSYEVQRVGGIYVIAEIDPDVITGFHYNDGIEPPVNAAADAMLPQGDAIASADDGNDCLVTIDVMVAYTADVAEELGGLQGLRAYLDNEFAAANLGYAESGVSQTPCPSTGTGSRTMRLRLAGIHEVDYDEPLSSGLADELGWLSTNGDGIMDSIHLARAEAQADLVALLLDSDPFISGACGIAWLPKTPQTFNLNFSFSVTSLYCAGPNISFAHEIGHNLGAAHDVSNSNGSSTDYGYGYFDSGYFRSVMSYSSLCGSGENACPRINRWSNPDLNVSVHPVGPDGQPDTSQPQVIRDTGSRVGFETNNARTLIENGYNYVEGYYGAPFIPNVSLTAPTGNTTLTNNQLTLSWPSTELAVSYFLNVYDAGGTQIATTEYQDKDCAGGVCNWTLTPPAGTQYGNWSVWATMYTGTQYGNWSSSTFTVNLNPVTLTSPIGSQGSGSSFDLTFNAEPGADSHRIDVYNYDASTPLIYSQTVDTTGCAGGQCNVNVPYDGAFGNYAAWIVPSDGNGAFGPWNGSSWRVDPPAITLTAPLDRVEPTGSDITISWLDVNGLNNYFINVYAPGGALALNTSVNTASCGGGICSVNVPFNGTTGTYFAYITGGTGSYFTPWYESTFEVNYELVSLTSPVGTTSPSSNILMLWNHVQADNYIIQVYDGFGAQVLDRTLDAATYCGGDSCGLNTPLGGFTGTYTAWIIPFSNSGTFGSWNSSTFDVLMNPVSLTSPTTNSEPTINANNTITLQWNAVFGATDYTVNVYDPTGAQIVNTSVSAADPAFDAYTAADIASFDCNGTCTLEMPYSGVAGTYSVWINPTGYGFVGAWTESVFTTATTPVLLSSPVGTIPATDTVTLQWQRQGAASSYTVNVYNSAGAVREGSVTASSVCSGNLCALNVPVNKAYGNHDVWIQPQGGPWALSQFTIDFAQVALTTSDEINNDDLTLTISWTHQPNIDTYAVDIYNQLGANLYPGDFPAASCLGDTCTLNITTSTSDITGGHDVWIQPRAGGAAGQWTFTPITLINDLAYEINVLRCQLDMDPLTVGTRSNVSPLQIETADIRHAADMVNNSFFSFTGSDGSTVGSRLNAAGYNHTFVNASAARSQPGQDFQPASVIVANLYNQFLTGANIAIFDWRVREIGGAFAYNPNEANNQDYRWSLTVADRVGAPAVTCSELGLSEGVTLTDAVLDVPATVDILGSLVEIPPQPVDGGAEPLPEPTTEPTLNAPIAEPVAPVIEPTPLPGLETEPVDILGSANE